MDDLHNESLLIPQVCVVVDFNDEFVNMPNPLGDPNFYYLTFASTSFGYTNSLNITINENLSTTIVIDEPLWLTMAKKNTFENQRVIMPQPIMQQICFSHSLRGKFNLS
jgi:hypothetical protein